MSLPWHHQGRLERREVWKGTGCDPGEDTHSTGLWGSPRVLPTPVPHEKYAAEKGPIGEHNAITTLLLRAVSNHGHSQFPIAQEQPRENWKALGNPSTHHRRLQKIFKRIGLIHFLLAGPGLLRHLCKFMKLGKNVNWHRRGRNKKGNLGDTNLSLRISSTLWEKQKVSILNNKISNILAQRACHKSQK